MDMNLYTTRKYQAGDGGLIKKSISGIEITYTKLFVKQSCMTTKGTGLNTYMRITTAGTFIYMLKGAERTESLRRTCNIIRHLLTECTTVIKYVWIASNWLNDGTYLRIGQ